VIRDSHDVAIEWEAANPARCRELCDALDVCLDIAAKRALYATLSKEEQNGVMPEYGRRAENRSVPVGALVRSAAADRGIPFTYRHHNGPVWASHGGLALVIGQKGHGDHTRYLMLIPPWRNQEGLEYHFVTANSHDLKVVGR
jgi:hypothetical protein